jgi:hypothetical protein
MINQEIVFTKEFVYFLGFLWSDGYIERKRTMLEIIEEDAKNIIQDIKKIDFLNICTMSRKRKNRKPQMSIYFCNVNFYDNFQSKYFQNKSEVSPTELLMKIPENLKRYFYQGLIDGDGCFYFKKSLRQFYITSSNNQDWTHIINLFKEIGIKQYEIRRVENKNGNKSSYIRVKKHDEIVNIYHYLYPDGYQIGLKRKYLKCKEIIDNPPKYSSNKSKLNEIEIISYIDSGLNIYQISEKLNCNWRKIHNFCKKSNIKKTPGFYRKSANQ